jgi:hypothetical protein
MANRIPTKKTNIVGFLFLIKNTIELKMGCIFMQIKFNCTDLLIKEHGHRDTGGAEVAVGHQWDESSGPQPPDQDPEDVTASGQREDLHPETFAELDEPLEQLRKG